MPTDAPPHPRDREVYTQADLDAALMTPAETGIHLRGAGTFTPPDHRDHDVHVRDAATVHVHDYARVLALLDAGAVTGEEIRVVAERHHLGGAWNEFLRRFVDGAR